MASGPYSTRTMPPSTQSISWFWLASGSSRRWNLMIEKLPIVRTKRKCGPRERMTAR